MVDTRWQYFFGIILLINFFLPQICSSTIGKQEVASESRWDRSSQLFKVASMSVEWCWMVSMASIIIVRTFFYACVWNKVLTSDYCRQSWLLCVEAALIRAKITTSTSVIDIKTFEIIFSIIILNSIVWPWVISWKKRAVKLQIYWRLHNRSQSQQVEQAAGHVWATYSFLAHRPWSWWSSKCHFQK